MRWTYTLGRVGETEIKLHLTFFLLLAYWAAGGYEAGGMSGAIGAVAMLIALFVCVLLHEFGHITMARRFGVRTPDVLILPIGGVARLERIPDEPRQELLIALAGPAVTLAIAAALYLVLRLSGGTADIDNLSPATPFVRALFQTNVLLLLFNLIPAFPMDGGRVLRALLATRMGLARATRAAATLGQLLAVAGGLAVLLSKNGNPVLLLIALFVFLGAGSEAAAVETRLAGRGLHVADMMVREFHTIPVHATLARAVELLLAGEQREFPVVDNLGRTEGLLTRDNLVRGLSQRGAGATVAEAMTRDVPAVSPTLPFGEALERLRGSGLPALPVVDGEGRLVGLLTRDNVADLLLVRRAGA
jgi:stage IV sporulation protein FB